MTTHGPDETASLGRRLGELLERGDVVVLTGDLGAGKTTFVRGVLEGVGAEGRAKSPSFTIVVEHAGRVPVYHVDAYRLTLEELVDAGIGEYLSGDGACLVEWGEKLQGLLPETHLEIEVQFATGDADTRTLAFVPHGLSWARRVSILAGGER